jgi:hypothetical protein
MNVQLVMSGSVLEVSNMNNTHERTLNAPIDTLAPLIDQLTSSQDLFWPSSRWSAMKFDRPLAVGAIGGHGFIGYTVERYEPGRDITFRFTSPKGLNGMHRLMLEELPNGQTRVKHVIEASLEGPMVLGWTLAIRFLHDALVEDAMDRTEAWIAQREWKPRELSPYVKSLRWLLAKLRSSHKPQAVRG